MRTAGKLLLGLIALHSLILGGCTRGPGPLTPVAGKVAYKGFPLQGGTIVFTPDATRGESGPISLGKINSDGSYSLSTGENKGAHAGWYRVTVTSLASSAMQVPGQPFTRPYSFLPEKYCDPELSQLSCEIKANRTNTIDFNLE